LQVVDTRAGKTASGADYPAIPAAGGSGRKTGTPCLELEPGVTITEGPAILQTIAAKGECAAGRPNFAPVLKPSIFSTVRR
jgi:hypothetical protein